MSLFSAVSAQYGGVVWLKRNRSTQRVPLLLVCCPSFPNYLFEEKPEKIKFFFVVIIIIRAKPVPIFYRSNFKETNK